MERGRGWKKALFAPFLDDYCLLLRNDSNYAIVPNKRCSNNYYIIYNQYSLIASKVFAIFLCSILQFWVKTYRFFLADFDYNYFTTNAYLELKSTFLYFSLCFGLMYRTRAIISRGLYIFTPFFSAVYNQELLILQTIYVLNKEMWA